MRVAYTYATQVELDSVETNFQPLKDQMHFFNPVALERNGFAYTQFKKLNKKQKNYCR